MRAFVALQCKDHPWVPLYLNGGIIQVINEWAQVRIS